MKHLMSCSLALLSIVLLLPTQAHAQVTGTLTFQSKFAFTAGHTTFPAGSYEVRPLDGEPNFLEIMNVKGTQAGIVEVETGSVTGATSKGNAQLTFKKYGSQYLLKTISAPGGSPVTLKETPKEQQHAKAGTPTDQSVTATSKK
jgi:hypothetical protein